jgi:hypothetical protein
MSDDHKQCPVTIVPVRKGENTYFALQWDDKPPSQLEFDYLATAIADAERMGCEPVTVTEAAIQAHNADPLMGHIPYEAYLPFARAQIRAKAIKHGWRDHSLDRRYSP